MLDYHSPVREFCISIYIWQTAIKNSKVITMCLCSLAIKVTNSTAEEETRRYLLSHTKTTLVS